MPWYHYSKKEIKELKNVEKQRNGTSKPFGLWLSYNDEWENILTSLSRYRTYYKYKVTFKKNINLCVIDSLESLEKFNKKYKDKSFKFFVVIDWEKVAKEYDGIKFINYYKLKKEFNDDFSWFSEVDINSICIWRPSKVLSKMILEGKVIITEEDYDSE
jgi:hypothetical protein